MLSDNKLVDVRGVFERCTCDERSVIVNLYSYNTTITKYDLTTAKLQLNNIVK